MNLKALDFSNDG